MKILLLTTQPEWKSWNRKLTACRGGLGLTRNIGSVEIDLERFTGKVLTAGDHVDRAWFNTLTIDARKRGYSAVVLHLGEQEAKLVGIKQTIRGATINDEVIGEMYVIADEDSRVVYKSGRSVDRFVKVFLHEMSHWMSTNLGQEDKTHYWDYEKENIALVMSSYSFPVGIWQSWLSMFRREYVYAPLKNWKHLRVTQPFGAKSSEYVSGIHAGVDVACPVGTQITAPTDGRIVLTWKDNKTLGNACTYEWYYNGKLYTLRLAHLKTVPKAGTYQCGDVIALTGNTGASTGPHLHLEVWKGGYNYDTLLREDTVRECLVNPVVLFNGISTNNI